MIELQNELPHTRSNSFERPTCRTSQHSLNNLDQFGPTFTIEKVNLFTMLPSVLPLWALFFTMVWGGKGTGTLITCRNTGRTPTRPHLTRFAPSRDPKYVVTRADITTSHRRTGRCDKRFDRTFGRLVTTLYTKNHPNPWSLAS